MNKTCNDNIAGKRLIFTVTTGRSGTGFLARALALVPQVTSTHEPNPSFVNVMRFAQQTPQLARDFWQKTKLAQIGQSTTPIYIETSHLFSKGFLEPLIELGYIPDLILLSRPMREVATSLYLLQTIPGRTKSGLLFLLSPDDPNVLPLTNWEQRHDYQLCYWYCHEVARRSQDYGVLIRSRGGRVAEIELAELRTVAGFQRLIHDLALPPLGIVQWMKFLRLCRRRVNSKAAQKRPLSLPENIDALEQEVQQAIGESV